MPKFLRWTGAFLALVPLFSCQNWLTRQTCQKVNWYQRGFDEAMQGKGRRDDPEINRCEKAGYPVPDIQVDVGFKAGMTSYCRPDIVYNQGKTGRVWNDEFCDPLLVPDLLELHREGLHMYCAIDNAFAAGQTGDRYQNVCPAGMERDFLREFRKGRHKYLTASVAQKRKDLKRLGRELLNLEHDRADLNLQSSSLPPESEHSQDTAVLDRKRITSDLSGVNTRIQEKHDRVESLRRQLNDDLRELAHESQPDDDATAPSR